MEPIDAESEYKEILGVLREHGGEMDYKTLNETLADKFEGIRLRLKTMKEKGLVEFDGVVPSFDSSVATFAWAPYLLITFLSFPVIPVFFPAITKASTPSSNFMCSSIFCFGIEIFRVSKV